MVLTGVNSFSSKNSSLFFLSIIFSSHLSEGLNSKTNETKPENKIKNPAPMTPPIPVSQLAIESPYSPPKKS